MLNYNMQGMSKSLSELFAMLKTAEVEIKKEHVVLMVNKTTNFKKSGKKTRGKRGKPKRDGKPVASPPKAPKVKPGVTCFYCKDNVHWKRNCPKYVEDKKTGKIAGKDKGICDIHVIDIYLTGPGVRLGYLIPVVLLKFVTLSRSNRISGAWRGTR